MENSFIVENLLRQKESLRLAFHTKIEYEDIAKTLSSLINTSGGDLILGVENKKVIGIDNAKTTAKNIHSYLIKNIKPTAPISIQTIVIKTKEVILISVWEGAKKPYQFNGIIYNRNENNTNIATPEKLTELISQRKSADFHWERMPLLGAELNDLDNYEIDKTIEFYKNYNKDAIIANSEDFLLKLGLIQNGNITNACMVLFGKNPIQYIPQSRIRITMYPSKNSGDHFIDDRMFEGNILKNISAIFEYLDTIYGKTLSVNGLLRTEKSNYPVIAMREGILNAIVHRDYNSVKGFLRISIFSDRTEISNYGTLPIGLTISDLKKEHDSILRNPDIAQICFYRKYIEMLGSGTLRMIKDCKANNFNIPKWKTTDAITTVIFSSIAQRLINDGVSDGVSDGVNNDTFFDGYNKETIDNLNDAISKAVDLLRNDGVNDGVSDGVSDGVKLQICKLLLLINTNAGIKTVRIAELINKPKPTIERYIKEAKRIGVLEYIGSPKTGGYYLTKQINSILKNE